MSRMLRNIVLVFLLACAGVLQAQQLKVIEFRADLTLTDAVKYPKEDFNGDRCGLIKLGLALPKTDIAFEGDIVSYEFKEGEWWIYMPRGSNWLTIKSKSSAYLPLRYEFEGLQGNVTYVMNVEKPSVGLEPEVISEQYLIFQIKPTDAVLEVNEQQWTVSSEGTARRFVRFGTYSYRVQAPNYYPETGTVTVNDPKNKKIVNVDLRPNFGWIEVKDGNAQGAAVYVDNAYIGKAPCKSEALKSGEHVVRIVKDMYAPYNEKVTVSDKETATLSPTLTADFARVTLSVDADAEIWVNEEKKGTRIWTGNLATGTYRIECRLASHEPTATTKEITNTMDGQTIILAAPKPIYGSLNVESTPDFAKIFIDGKVMGETPHFIPQLLIGQHELKLTKEGYADFIQAVTITKSERKQVLAILIDGLKDEETFTVNGVSFTMKLIEGGTFQMGAQKTNPSGQNYDNEAKDEESPVHSVTLSSYYMGETEVTQALWKAVMGTEPLYEGGWENRYGRGSEYPAYRVSWNDIQDFIRKLNQKTGKNFRLPTEAEWEYAARGGKKNNGNKYAGSNTIDRVAWYKDNSGNKTHAVKTKSSNELGLYDMSGNVCEWCQDWYGSDYYRESPSMNPQGPSSGFFRVHRGGSWVNNACRVSIRGIYDPGGKIYRIGFRLCLPR